MNRKLMAFAALGSAGLASVCCIGPLILAGLGVSGLGLAGLTRYRLVFLGLTGLILAAAFYLVYRKPAAACADGSCAQRPGNRGLKAGLWIVTALAAVMASFPSWSSLLPAASRSAVPTDAIALTFSVSNMHCAACAAAIKKSVEKVPGVTSADINYENRFLKVAVRPGTDSGAVSRAVDAAGYKAMPVP